MRHEALEELIEAADAVWEDAAHSGADETVIISGSLIRRLALALVDVRYNGAQDMRELAEQWPVGDTVPTQEGAE